MTDIRITVNGEARSVSGDRPHERLLDWLRDEGLTGAKEGCAEGECGACAVLVAKDDGRGGTRWTAVNACLPPTLAFDGQEVVTSEGLGEPATPISEGRLHEVQREMAVRGGSQCGYCTPGFICSMAAEFYREDRTPVAGTATPANDGTASADAAADASAAGDCPVHDEHLEGANGFDLHSLSGNLCRCTGYRAIRDAAFALGQPEADDPFARRRALAAPAPVATRVRTTGGTRRQPHEAEFTRPATLAEALELYAANPDAQLVAGSTDAGVESNIRGTRPQRVIAIDRIDELRTLERGDDAIVIGAALTLSEAERALDGTVPLLAELFPLFASRLIRNAATLGGNLGTGSPIGDSAPVLLALGAELVLASAEGERTVPLAEYFTGYRQTVRVPGELIKAVRIPLPLATKTAFFKVAKRRFDDISSVAAGFAVDVVDGTVVSARIGLGGVAATPIRATATEQALVGREWSIETAARAAEALAAEGTPLDDMRASSAYRSAVLGQLLMKFWARAEGPTLTRTTEGAR